MRRSLSRAICAVLLGGTMLAVAAPAANAADAWDRPSQDFGSRSVGTTSDPQTFALVATCSADTGFPAFFCTNPPGGIHSYGPITTAGVGFAIVPDTDGCNARGGVLVTSMFASSQDVCTLQVTFKPTSGGTKTGSLSTTTSPSGAPLKVALKGIGVGTGTTTTAKKKCKKKKRSAVAAKKCKKK